MMKNTVQVGTRFVHVELLDKSQKNIEFFHDCFIYL